MGKADEGSGGERKVSTQMDFTSGEATVALRPARSSDLGAVRTLLKEAGGDAQDLVVNEFMVAEVDGRIVGCARLKRYPDCLELASLAVVPEQQGQRIGTALVESLLSQAARPVYLTCKDENVTYFRRFGFGEVTSKNLPESILTKSNYCASVFSNIRAMVLVK